MPGARYFKPRGIPLSELEEVVLTVDELEAVRLADLMQLYQSQAAEKMNVSRQTFGRIIESAHRKIAQALVDGKALRIEGGEFELSDQQITRRKQMKIAVASMDGTTISGHFGRSSCFIIFETDGKGITGKEIRQNTFTAHAQGECTGEERHEHTHEHAHHSHSAIVEALHDCDAVLCYGMGWRAAQDLAANGIKAYVLESESTPDEAVMQFLSGSLKAAGSFCRCHE